MSIQIRTLFAFCSFFLAVALVKAKTELVRDIVDGPASSTPNYLINVDGTLYFAAQDGNGEELWRSDGTEAGTTMVIDLDGAVTSSRPESLIYHNGLIFFIADGGEGVELWKSDGTAAGTEIVKDINPGAGDGIRRFQAAFDWQKPPVLLPVGNLLYFAADDGQNGTELWKSDGTEAGTEMVADIFGGPDHGFAVDDTPRMAAVGNTLFFFARSSTTVGVELWKSDGTEAGTMIVEELNTVPNDSVFPNNGDVDRILAATSTHFFFRGFDGTDFGLYVSDGTSQGTSRLVTAAPSGVSSPNFLDSLTVWKDRLFFRANTDGNGGEIWVSDGTPGGTQILKEIRAGNFSGAHTGTEMVASGDYLYFRATRPDDNDLELWRTDGSEKGTILIRDINTSTSTGSRPHEMVDVNGVLYFAATDTFQGIELFRSDGTLNGTYLVDDLDEGSDGSSPVELTRLGRGVVYQFNNQDDNVGAELHKTCCDSVIKQQIVNLGDTDNDGSPELASFRVDDAERLEVRVHDSITGQQSAVMSFLNQDWIESELLKIELGQESAIGVVAHRNDGLPIIQIRDETGGLVRNLFPWNGSWRVIDTDLVDLPGTNGAVATLAQRKSDGLMGVELRDPNDNTRIRIVYPLGFGWTPVQLQTMEINGQAAVAVLATRDSDNLTIVQIRNAATGVLIRNVFPLGFGWTAIEFKKLPDQNGNGAEEVAVRMIRDNDGLMIVQVRDGLNNTLINNIYPIGAGGNGWATRQIESVIVNGTDALAILSIRESDNQVLVQIRDLQTGGVLKNNFFIAPPWEFQNQFVVLPSFAQGASDELAVPMRDITNGVRFVQIRDGFDATVIRNVFLPN
ncbi:MAG: hypothetical protein AAF438_10295 [Pseudomonadota bacterium]